MFYVVRTFILISEDFNLALQSHSFYFARGESIPYSPKPSKVNLYITILPSYIDDDCLNGFTNQLFCSALLSQN